MIPGERLIDCLACCMRQHLLREEILLVARMSKLAAVLSETHCRDEHMDVGMKEHPPGPGVEDRCESECSRRGTFCGRPTPSAHWQWLQRTPEPSPRDNAGTPRATPPARSQSADNRAPARAALAACASTLPALQPRNADMPGDCSCDKRNDAAGSRRNDAGGRHGTPCGNSAPPRPQPTPARESARWLVPRIEASARRGPPRNPS